MWAKIKVNLALAWEEFFRPTLEDICHVAKTYPNVTAFWVAVALACYFV